MKALLSLLILFLFIFGCKHLNQHSNQTTATVIQSKNRIDQNNLTEPQRIRRLINEKGFHYVLEQTKLTSSQVYWYSRSKPSLTNLTPQFKNVR